MDEIGARVGAARRLAAAVLLVIAVPAASFVVPNEDPRCVRSPSFMTEHGRDHCPTGLGPADRLVPRDLGDRNPQVLELIASMCEGPTWRWGTWDCEAPAAGDPPGRSRPEDVGRGAV
jgi:hypothetical protein